MLATFPDQVQVIVIDPIDVDHTTADHVQSPAEPARRRSPASPSGPADGGPSLLVRGVEDDAMSVAVQRRAARRRQPVLEFGRTRAPSGTSTASLAGLLDDRAS